MRKRDWILLGVGVVSAFAWTLVAGKDGFKGGNALIVARSMSISATIEGQVNSDLPAVGELVRENDVLVSIRNARLDQGRLMEYQTNVDFLQQEIANAEQLAFAIEQQLEGFRLKAANHAEWMLEDIRLRNTERARFLEIAEMNQQLKADQMKRAAKLYKQQHTATAMLQTVEIEAQIASSEVDLSRTALRRNQLLQSTVQANGMFFENGDASYWDRMVDELLLRQTDNNSRLASFLAQLTRAQSLAESEEVLMEASIEEKHRAPFTAMVHATYVDKGSRVSSGTSLLQILDCTKPVAIVPIPENQIGDFKVGMTVTVYPVDSDVALPGSISYISSGPLIGHDQTLLVQEALTLSGTHAVVNFSRLPKPISEVPYCEPARKAIVIIHNQERFAGFSKWVGKKLAFL